MLARSSKVRHFVQKTLFGIQKRNYAKMQTADLQEAALEERCILIDDQDHPLGDASKRYCHRVASDGSVPLHRAFSVFLFNRGGDLLLQKRSANKITFPSHYSNSCCSHPLAEMPGEMEEKNALGIRRAAQRRLAYELGIPVDQTEPNEFTYLTRIHYNDIGDGYWGEHEIAYMLFLQKDEVTLDPNPDEISEVRWVSKEQMPEFLKGLDCPLTPWFKLITTHLLPAWWDNLDSLKKIQDHKRIQRFMIPNL